MGPGAESVLSSGGVFRLVVIPLAGLGDGAAAAAWLRGEELGQWREFANEKRRREWLAGRIAAKRAVGELSGRAEDGWPDLAIGREEDGRPCLAGGDASLFLSISHSGGLAAALAADLPCGLDIQEPSPKLLRARGKFSSPAEEAIIQTALTGPALAEIERLALLWAAKEAIRKLVRVSPLLGLGEIRLVAGEGCATPEKPLILDLAPGREGPSCPARVRVFSFMADELAWGLTFMETNKE